MKFLFIGWVNESNHDKVWASFEYKDKLYCAWGRRGSKLQFKDHGPKGWSNEHDLNKVTTKKKKKYNPIDDFLLFAVFPSFKEKCQEELDECLKIGKIK